MKLTGKCKEALVRYIVKKYPNEHEEILEMIAACILTGRIEMIFSLLVDFFDSVGIHLKDSPYIDDHTLLGYRTDIYKDIQRIWYRRSSTRHEARTAAITKADQLFNEQ